MYSNDIICKVLIYIENNLEQDLNIDLLSKKFYINRFYLMKLFKNEIHLTIINYINHLKIYNSLNDLKYNNSILKVALKNGFSSQEYYCETFKKVMNITPLEYKKYCQNVNLINESNLSKIIDKINYLNDIINYKNYYLQNRIPEKSITTFPSIF